MAALITLAPAYVDPLTGKGQSDEYVNPISGGTSAFAWSSPSALADGGEITITSDTYTFATPEKLAIIGFGQGWLAGAAEDAPLVDHTVSTITGTEGIDYEYTPVNSKRFVKTVDGSKYLRALISGTDAGAANAGFINYDTGSDFAAGEYSFMYSRARITLRPEDTGLTPPQFKQDRIGAAANLEGDVYNSCYVKQDPGGGTPAITVYPGNAGSGAYYFSGGVLDDGHVTDYAWCWKQNTPDMEDGNQWHITAKNGSFTRSRPYFSGAPNYPTGIIKSSSPLRPRWMKYQDYIGNTAAIDAEILRTDIFLQKNGSLFFIADSADPATCTMFCPLVPIQINNSGSWKFKLWKGRLSDYSNASIFVLNENLELIVGVDLHAS